MFKIETLCLAEKDSEKESSTKLICPSCGVELDHEWLSLRDTLRYLRISNSHRIRLQRQGFLPPPTLTLGSHSPRWRRRDLDAALEAGRQINGVFTQAPSPAKAVAPAADAAVEAVLRNLGRRKPEPDDIQTPWR
jgi:hypothetical protein